MLRTLRWLAALAVVAPILSHAQELGLKLKPQYQLLPPPPQESKEPTSIFVEADKVEGIQDQSFDAVGKVTFRARGRTLFADKVEYCVPAEQVTATGNVLVDRQGDTLGGDKVFLDLKNDTGKVDDAKYFFRAFQARGNASRLDIESKTRYRADAATYSTCAVPEKGWYLKVKKLDIDQDKDKGVARGAKVYFKDIPILYTPYIDFPLSNARKSGFLSPTYGTTGRSGFEFTLPYYLNLAPNYDATITPRFLAKRGIMVANEFRYLSSSFNGLLNAELLPNDRERQGETRYGLAFRHNHQITSQLTGYTNLQKVSDDLYFVDLSNRIAVTSLTNLPREGGLNYSGGWWNLASRVQSFQTLQDPLRPIVPPYERLPQLTLTALRPNQAGFDLNFFSEYVSFSHPTLVTAQRSTLYPSVAYPLQTSFINVVPKIGLHHTRYDLSAAGIRNLGDGVVNDGATALTRTLPIFSLDSTVTFERNMTFRGTPWIQTLEPRLYYVYIPFRDQRQIPVFDTALADFNLAQIFTENQFVGGDRINDANQLTGALSTRFIDPDNGRERLRMTVAQRFFFRNQDVNLPGGTTRAQNRSDVLAGIMGQMTDSLYLDFATTLDINEYRPDRSTLALRYNPQPGKVFNVGYRFFRDSFEQIDLSAQWPFNDQWSGVGKYTYSLRDRQAVTTIAGLEYNSGCWIGRFVFQQFVTLTNQSSRALFFQIEFSGLSKLGSNPNEILRQNIAGYQRLNGLPQVQEEYYPVR